MWIRARHRRQDGVQRLEVFHRFCALSPDAQTVVAELVRWLYEANPQTREQLLASLDALALRVG